MSTEEEKIQTARQPYHKPQLEEVKLIAEEAVLGNCKTTGTAGPTWAGNCHNPAGHNPCSSQGS